MGNARSVIKRLRFPLDIMLLCVRWYVAYALSLRNLEEMMQEGSVALRGARVKVGCTVSPQVSDPVGVNPPGCRIVALRTDLSRRRASALCGSVRHKLDATKNDPRRTEVLEALYRARDALDRAMVLLDNVVEVFVSTIQ
jgi:hypothetical protein